MLPFALNSARYRERPSVHIGVLSLSVVLQSFRRLRKPGKKHAVTVNTGYRCPKLVAFVNDVASSDSLSACHDAVEHAIALYKGW